jgi:nicotinamidase-related amidase
MLDTHQVLFIVIDAQVKLAQVMCQSDAWQSSMLKVLEGAIALELPILLTEQVPEKLGETLPVVRDLLPDLTVIQKSSFSCWGDPVFREQVKATGRRQMVLVGIETHICVCQTSLDLLSEGYQVHIIQEAVRSRSEGNHQLGLQRMRDAGAVISGLEMVLFEMMKTADHQAFRTISRIIR